MKYIANIVTASALAVKKETYKFCSLVNVTTDFGSIDRSLPTLIVGYKLTKELFPEVKIFQKKINKNTFWTFTSIEKRTENQADMDVFKLFVKNSVRKQIEYTFFNVFKQPYSRLKRLISYIKCGGNTIYCTKNNAFVFYSGKLFGISMDDMEYAGIKREKVIEIAKKGNKVFTDMSFLDPKDVIYIGDDNILRAYFCGMLVF